MTKNFLCCAISVGACGTKAVIPLTRQTVHLQLGHVAESEAAFRKTLSLNDPDNPGVHAMRMLAQMKQGLGDHWGAIRLLTKALDLDTNPERIQCLFLRGRRLPPRCFFRFTTQGCLPQHHVTGPLLCSGGGCPGGVAEAACGSARCRRDLQLIEFLSWNHEGWTEKSPPP